MQNSYDNQSLQLLSVGNLTILRRLLAVLHITDV